MGFPQRSDNIMQNMAREVNLLEHDRRQEAEKPISEKQMKMGKIAFGVMLGVFVLIIALFVFL